MSQTYYFEELDDVSQDYLRDVRDREGRGFAGIFAGTTNWLPWVGLVLGIVTIGFTMWLTMPPLAAPWNVTLLQMAGFLLGGWMIVAALRIWFASGQNYLGHFVFADSLHLWEAAGPVVTVTKLKNLQGATGLDNFNEGTYQNTAVTLELAKGKHAVTIYNLQKAGDLIAFCNALAMLRGTHGAGPGMVLSDGALGQTAMGLIGLGPHPEEHERAASDDPDYIPTAALAEGIAPVARLAPPRNAAPDPPTPVHTHQARSGIIAYIVIVLIGVVGLFPLHAANAVWHDNAWFRLVKDKDPPELRAYLIDPAKTRHREKVKELLDGFYDPLIERIERNPGADGEVGAEFIALIKELKAAPQPLITLRVREDTPGRPADASREQDLERKLTDSLYQVFTHNRQDGRRVEGNKLIDTVKPVEGVPPILEVTYSFDPIPGQQGKVDVNWTIKIRRKWEQQEAKVCTRKLTPRFLGDYQPGIEEGLRHTMTALRGQEWPRD